MDSNELSRDWIFEGIGREYFEWLIQLVSDGAHAQSSFRSLFRCLHTHVFMPPLPMDANRAEDGVDLRYRFGYEKGYADPVIASHLDFFPCTVFEMMVALSFRCEEQIMGDPLKPFQAGKWFWGMIDSLGLSDQADEAFDAACVRAAVDRFLHREYARDGRGGLFTIRHSRMDMRAIEIWYQLCCYLSTVE